MGRRNYSYLPVNCTLGINQQDEKIRSGQCLDARNFWAPAGKLETRPGYIGLTHVRSDRSTVQAFTIVGHDVSADAYAASLVGLVGRVASGGDMDRIYITSASQFDSIGINVAPGVNTAGTTWKGEYWNGSIWARLYITQLSSSDDDTLSNLFSEADVNLHLARPRDWATTTINGTTGYSVRLNLLGANIAGAPDVSASSTTSWDASPIVGSLVAQFPTGKRYLHIAYTAWTTPRLTLWWAADPFLGGATPYYVPYSGAGSIASFSQESERASYAIVPQFNEIFVAFSGITFRLTNPPVARLAPTTTKTTIIATVESDPNLVGPGAYYDTTLIAQESTFPQAKYIMFFKNILWAANLQGYPHQIRWSGPAPYHKVWPSIQTEPLMENDNSPISGLTALGEYPVVFKNDSIWMMVFGGFDAFNLTTFTPTKIVSGVGCVSNSSIREIRGRLVFLAEDGLYAFDGTPNIKKITEDRKTGADRLKTTIASVAPGRRPFAAAAHWRKHSLYLLSVQTNTATTDANNLIIVWDYLNDSFWLWNNIEAQFWLEDEDSYDNETLYFGDASGRIYQMGVGQTDHGAAITATLTSGRLAKVGATTTLRTVNADVNPSTRSLSLIIRPEDRSLDQITGTLDATDYNEDDWSTLNWSATSQDNWRPPDKRSLRLDFRETAAWHRLLLSHNTRNQKAEIASLEVGLVPVGRR